MYTVQNVTLANRLWNSTNIRNSLHLVTRLSQLSFLEKGVQHFWRKRFSNYDATITKYQPTPSYLSFIPGPAFRFCGALLLGSDTTFKSGSKQRKKLKQNERRNNTSKKCMLMLSQLAFKMGEKIIWLYMNFYVWTLFNLYLFSIMKNGSW